MGALRSSRPKGPRKEPFDEMFDRLWREPKREKSTRPMWCDPDVEYGPFTIPASELTPTKTEAKRIGSGLFTWKVAFIVRRLRTDDQPEMFYTGKAGVEYVSERIDEGFGYATFEEAQLVADRFSRQTEVSWDVVPR